MITSSWPATWVNAAPGSTTVVTVCPRSVSMAASGSPADGVLSNNRMGLGTGPPDGWVRGLRHPGNESPDGQEDTSVGRVREA